MSAIPSFDDLLATIHQRNHARMASQAFRINPYTPEEESSVLGDLGSTVLSGVGYIDGSLDKALGGRAIRSAIGLAQGNKKSHARDLLSILPFSDALGITKPEQATAGSDITGDPYSGFALELATNPGTYLTLGAGALTKSGRAAKAAGLLDDAAKVASNAAGKTVGKRVARLTTTAGDLLAANPAKQQAFTDAAIKLGIDPAKAATQKLGGMAGVGLPFMQPKAVFGTGQRAQQAAALLDKVGMATRNTKPVRYLAAQFSAPNMGATSKEIQPVAQSLYKAREAIEQEEGLRAAKMFTKRKAAGLADDAGSPILRREAEGIDTGNSAAKGIAGQFRSADDELLAEARRTGANIGELYDPAGIKHVGRQFVGIEPGTGSPLGSETIKGALRKKRRGDYLRGFKGGTEQVRELIGDQIILQAGSDKDAAKYILGKYGHDMLPPAPSLSKSSPKVIDELLGLGMQPKDIDKLSPQEQWQVLLGTGKSKVVAKAKRSQASSLQDLVRYKTDPAQRARGGFGHDVQFDMQRGLTHGRVAVATADAVAEALAQHAQPLAKVVGQRQAATVRLGDVLKNSGISHGDHAAGGLSNVAKKMGLDLSAMPPKDALKAIQQIKDMVVPAHVARDLDMLGKGFNHPEAANGALRVIDSLTNAFKAGVLTWPARYVRDHLSGTYLNAATGNWSLKAHLAARQLAHGVNVKAALDIPHVQRMLVDRGLAHSPENATQMLRELFYGTGVTGARQGAYTSSNLTGPLAGTINGGTAKDFAAQFAGHDPITPRSIAEKLLTGKGIEGGGSWKPWEVAGVGDSQQTRFTPVAAGNDIGQHVENINRGTPFIHNLLKGADPARAKQIADALQVNYTGKAYTKFEREVMMRLAPFYKYSRGILPTLATELMEKPGGGVAQTLRGMHSGGQEQGFRADYLSGGLNVPLGAEKDGNQRYLTQSGLPTDLLNLLETGPGGIKKTGLNLLGMMNPLAKAPLELMTGRSFYKDRDLKELDPRVGRTLEQFGLTNEPHIMPYWLEHLLMNSPASRAISTVGTLADSRKGVGDKAANLLTGLRISDVDQDKAKGAAVRQYVSEALRGRPNVRTFQELYVPPDKLAEMSPQDIMLLRLLKTDAQRATKAAKERKKHGNVAAH